MLVKDMINSLASKALKLNEDTEALVQQFEGKGYEIENKEYLNSTKKQIYNILNKSRPTKRDVELLKEFTSVNQYDQIKVIMDLREDTDDDISVPQDKEISLRQIRLSLRHQVLDPTKLTEEEHQIISEYARANAQYDNTQAADLSTPEAQRKFKQKFSVLRDVAIGGSSTLINDLSYTYDALWIGRKFVETLQKIMRDPKIFIELEYWYQNESDGQNCQYMIQQAVKDAWYEEYQKFSEAILEAIDSLPSMDGVDEELEDFRNVVEVHADEYFRQ